MSPAEANIVGDEGIQAIGHRHINRMFDGVLESFLELAAVYYVGGCILQFLVPWIISVNQLQDRERPNGQILRDAIRSIGEMS